MHANQSYHKLETPQYVEALLQGTQSSDSILSECLATNEMLPFLTEERINFLMKITCTRIVTIDGLMGLLKDAIFFALQQSRLFAHIAEQLL